MDPEANRETLLAEKCGIFAAIANGDWPTSLDVAQIICLGLVGLQHRGQEAAGIVTCKFGNIPFSAHRNMGLVSQIFNDQIIKALTGNLGIGHTRYSTMGGSENVQLAQPFVVHTSYGTIAVAHNGELVNSQRLRQTILENGVGLSTGSDSELITQCLSLKPPKINKRKDENENIEKNVEEANESNFTLIEKNLQRDEEEILSRVLHFMSLTPLSYSLILMYEECIYAVRDPFGNRPLCIGTLVPPPHEGGPRSSQEKLAIEGWVVSSESCSFPSVCAKIWRDVEPGEIVKLARNKLPKTLAIVHRKEDKMPATCIFEYVYFARPDSLIEGQMVYTVRRKCGQQLAIEAPVQGKDPKIEYIVAPVPESSIPAALGFSQQSGIPYVEVFCKNRYVGRTFIQPSTRLRRLGVAKKFGPLSHNFQGKSVILIDDSIVRGTTIGQLIRLLKDSGAVEVHIRIASPPLHYPCYMGINIPTKEELIANQYNARQLAQYLGAASLVHLSVEGLLKSVQSGIRDKSQNKAIGHCTACLTGCYPVPLDF
ncbi:glutamine phosphoribosylpyrophosphate amidotransferase-like protein [Dinothrombium tinctorium]|uniref:Amidophosphoribosyltransferase n=1 Tax=Dinothrombium tinctorium TaxID=1965070 RepID=A0A443QS50_9ACAR|nr:glutamine phosphoribosylpyrophosphate amidotransferase-like protein [Dinothrombium tinctorium]